MTKESQSLVQVEELEWSPEYRRKAYLNSQLMLLAMATRFGLWLISDLSFKTTSVGTPPEEKLRIKETATKLAKGLGDYITQLGLFYGRWLTNREPVNHVSEQAVWTGATLGGNPLERIYQVWQESIVGSGLPLEEALEQKLRFRHSALKGKEQLFIPLEAWIIRPWLLDREDFERNKLEDFYQNHPLYEGIHWFGQHILTEIGQSLKPIFKKYFPKGAVIFANLISGLPDAAIVAHWIKHSKRRRQDTTMAVYNSSPAVEEVRGIHFPDCEEQFLMGAVERGLPVLAVDSFASTGGTIVESFKFFVPKIREIAAQRGFEPVPFYFLVTTGGANLTHKICASLKDELGEISAVIFSGTTSSNFDKMVLFGLAPSTPSSHLWGREDDP